MQELLGRLRSLDPQASQSLRVIACFDELMSGGVAVHGLLSAAAALAGVPAGLDREGVTVRVDPRGQKHPGPAPSARMSTPVADGATVWLERDASQPLANDAIILERLALALRLRLDPRAELSSRLRDLTIALDDAVPVVTRREAAARLGLRAGARFRVIAAPLFATWSRHPRGPEDVVSTAFGPVHVAVIDPDDEPFGTPLGIGIAVRVEDLGHSLRTALIALRLHDADTPVRADELGGLAEVLAELPEDGGEHDPEAAALSTIMDQAWGRATVEALVHSSSMREAARAVGIHHSTMAARLHTIERELGFDPLSGLGRTRLGVAFLRWRLRHSRVLDLPSPTR